MATNNFELQGVIANLNLELDQLRKSLGDIISSRSYLEKLKIQKESRRRRPETGDNGPSKLKVLYPRSGYVPFVQPDTPPLALQADGPIAPGSGEMDTDEAGPSNQVFPSTAHQDRVSPESFERQTYVAERPPERARQDDPPRTWEGGYDENYLETDPEWFKRVGRGIDKLVFELARAGKIQYEDPGSPYLDKLIGFVDKILARLINSVYCSEPENKALCQRMGTMEEIQRKRQEVWNREKKMQEAGHGYAGSAPLDRDYRRDLRTLYTDDPNLLAVGAMYAGEKGNAFENAAKEKTTFDTSRTEERRTAQPDGFQDTAMQRKWHGGLSISDEDMSAIVARVRTV